MKMITISLNGVSIRAPRGPILWTAVVTDSTSNRDNVLASNIICLRLCSEPLRLGFPGQFIHVRACGLNPCLHWVLLCVTAQFMPGK